MISGRELRSVLLRGPYAVIFYVVYGTATLLLVLFFFGVLEAAAVTWVPFGAFGVLVLGAVVARRERSGHEADRDHRGP